MTLFTGSLVRGLGGAVFTVLLAAACVTDIRSRRIPNVLVGALGASGLAFGVSVDPIVAGLVHSVSGMALGFAIWIGFYMLGLLGAGDVKLFAAAGAWLGPGGTWRAALLAALIGGVLAIAMLVKQRRAADGVQRIALSMAHLTSAPLRTTGVPEGGSARHHLPYGVALALGALIAAWVPRLGV